MRMSIDRVPAETAPPPPISESWMACYRDLAADIRHRAAGRSVLLIVHPGNWGDSLIAHGTRNFLRYYGIAYTEVSARPTIKSDERLSRTLLDFPPERFMPLFTVGGSITPHYRYVEKLRAAARAYGGGVVLPGNCGFSASELGLPDGCSFWVRDRGESARNLPAAPFCHDMAFFERAHRPLRLRPHGLFLRRDVERPAYRKGGIDPSGWGKEYSPAGLFIRLVGSHRAVTTNRLHIAIAAVLCGSSVELLPSSTAKIADVYHASLAEYSNDVRYDRQG